MAHFLSKRQPDLVEQMDRENCNRILLENTYEQFPLINTLLSKWKQIYKKELLPLMSEQRTYSLLDIGFGGGDIPVKIAQWAKKDGVQLNITAIDTDIRAFNYVQETYPAGLINWQHTSSTDLALKKQKFDFVISNHVLHHLSENQIPTLLKETRELAAKKVIFNDIERNVLGFFLFKLITPFIFHNSFITEDGLTSIRKSFTYKELQKRIPQGWNVKRLFPYRLLLTYEKS
jgi:2-polyprenyl-3-methyl-5-hydroxy-6-metoxy-1,4-benzoquinol methylase